MSKLHKHRVFYPVVFIIFVIVIPVFIFIAIKNPTHEDKKIIAGANLSIEKAIQTKNINEVRKLIDVEGESIVGQIKNVDELEKLDPQFSRSYEGDVIIFSTDKTIIYDSSTKTIRDIIGKSFLEEVKNSKE